MVIKCKTQDTLPISALTEFQGGLKERTNEDYEKILRSIEKHGFSFPFFVWKIENINYVLDGHGRLGALQRLIAKGEQLPEFPVVYVDCKDESEAKEILLKLNSQYGTMTAESVQSFIGELKIEIDDLSLPAGTLELGERDVDEKAIGEPEISTESSFKYEQQYGVIVICKNESEQEATYNQLLGEGFECRVVAV